MTAVRAAATADLARLADIHALAFARPWSEAALAELLATPGTLALLADGEGDVGGFVLLRVVAGEGEVLTLAVSPARRRRGLGRALVDAALDAGAAEGAAAVWLEVAEDNHAARGLYEAAGFAEAGRRKAYYPRAGAPAVDAVVLRRILNSPAPSAYAAAP
jgi:ribosomal-protein-alanine N-acetyltransferase